MSAASLAKRIVGIDQVIMYCFLISLTVVTYIVNIDAENHRNLLFETNEFSIIVTNLPKITADYSVDQLKRELWSHLVKVLSNEKQQIGFLKDDTTERATEIVDIQFAMQDQKALDEVKAI